MKHKTREELIAFEQRIVELFKEGELPFLIHLGGGNEDQLIEIFSEITEGDWVFSTHRSHLHYLLAGGSPERLEQLIRDGRSMFIFDNALNFVTSSILAGTCCIAAGVALALKQAGSKSRCWVFLGDGSEEQGHVYEAVSFVHWNDLSCVFVVEDNDRQVDTSKAERRPLGGQDWPCWPSCVRRYEYTPTFPHGGAGLPAGSVRFKAEIVAKFAALDAAGRS